MTDTLTTYGPHNAPNPFYRADGRLNAYGLACGYVQKHATDKTHSSVQTHMWREGNCYHMRTTFDSATQFQRLAWDTADTLTEAYKLYGKHIRQYHKGK